MNIESVWDSLKCFWNEVWKNILFFARAGIFVRLKFIQIIYEKIAVIKIGEFAHFLFVDGIKIKAKLTYTVR